MSFRSKKHIVHTITVNKLALSADNDKRFICDIDSGLVLEIPQEESHSWAITNSQ